jgi:flagellar hook-associated protein 1
MSDLLAIGASGIKAYSKALSVVGDNIANAQTEGYVRRSARLEEAPAAGDIILSRNALRPGGVLAAGVTRAVDQWLTDDARTAAGEASRQSARLEWLSATERALGNGGSDIASGVTAIFTAADRLTADPGSNTLRRQFLQAVDDSAAAFRQTAAALSSAASGVATDARQSVDKLNTDLAALSRVNDGLRRARPGSSNEATLLDERDRLISGIANATDITVAYDGRGAATIRARSGDVLLDRSTIGLVALSVAADGQLSFTLAAAAAFTPSSGKLAGLTAAASHIAGQRE